MVEFCVLTYFESRKEDLGQLVDPFQYFCSRNSSRIKCSYLKCPLTLPLPCLFIFLFLPLPALYLHPHSWSALQDIQTVCLSRLFKSTARLFWRNPQLLQNEGQFGFCSGPWSEILLLFDSTKMAFLCLNDTT